VNLEAERCLYTLVLSPREEHENLLRAFVEPAVREFRDSPELDSLFFARYSIPDWQIRLRILGHPGWVDDIVRPGIARRLDALAGRGLFREYAFTTYAREDERYGGREGMRLAERIFHHDSLLCLELMAADREGLLGKSRRELSLVLTERLLDLLGFDRERRTAFYELGYRWAIEQDRWTPEERAVLEERYLALRPGLTALFDGSAEDDPTGLWGGSDAARIASDWIEALRPAARALMEAHAAGRVAQDPVQLAWSLAHMHCNRLGIDAMPEAILRFFMHRLYLDGAVGG